DHLVLAHVAVLSWLLEQVAVTDHTHIPVDVDYPLLDLLGACRTGRARVERLVPVSDRGRLRAYPGEQFPHRELEGRVGIGHLGWPRLLARLEEIEVERRVGLAG